MFDPKLDLILTYDLALRIEIEAMGGRALYVDHLVDRDVMQENNFLTYQFFREWHFDGSGADIFTYRDVPFGFSFRIEFWNDYLFYVRARLCLERLRELSCEAVYAGTQLGLLETILEDLGVAFTRVRPDPSVKFPSYFFPIHHWMTENIRRGGLISRLRMLYTWSVGTLLSWADRALPSRHSVPAVFVQEYHPTRPLIRRMQAERRVRVVAAAMSRAVPWARYLPLWARAGRFKPIASDLLEQFRRRRCARLILTTGADISDRVYELIERRVVERLAESIRVIHCVGRYLDRNPLQLLVLTGNIGEMVTLLDCVAKARGIPSFLIINGLLGPAFLDESKYATVINAYSTSIKGHYFRDMTNVVCLGDPRMDAYPPGSTRVVNRQSFTVTVGASGHDNIELNSYLAVEFDFMHDVLCALQLVRQAGADLRVVIKVRPNGYRAQYEYFVNELFPGLAPEILDFVPIRDILLRTDLYISIDSQTLFEASCLSIPCLYYRKGNEIKDPPFDGRSELVTVDTVEGLVQAVNDFRAGHPRYDAFLKRVVMEKYIGPLDGGNVQRNLDFVYGLLEPAVAPS